jgi:uncharacterized protein (TIGR02466 family)
MSKFPPAIPLGPVNTRQQAAQLITRAVAAHRDGDDTTAEQNLRQVLAFEPFNPDALQLLGLLAKARGDLAGAEALMRRSIGVNRLQPHVHSNLAAVLRLMGRAEEALFHVDVALKLLPKFADAHLNRAEALVLLGKPEEALLAYQTGLALAPGSTQARVGMAALLGRRGRAKEAEDCLLEGLAIFPDEVFLNHNLGVLYLVLGRYPEALPILRKVTRLAPQSAPAWLTLGNALNALGQHEEAITCYRRTVDLDPANFDAHRNLNHLLWELGRQDGLLASYRRAISMRPADPAIREMAAEAALTFEEWDLAEADLAEAARLNPDSLPVARMRVSLLIGRGLTAEALDSVRKAVERVPEDQELLRLWAQCALFEAKGVEALEAARRLGRVNRLNQWAAAYEATALRLLGEPGADYFFDYNRFVYVIDLDPPEGYADIAAFHAELLPALRAMHDTVQAPISQTLRHGTQTRENLFDRPHTPAIVRLLGQHVMAATRRFAADLDWDLDHPFLRRKGMPLDWAGSWSVWLRDQGHHIDHLHPQGWLSGSYYVEIPDCVTDEEAKPGWITFGGVKLGPNGVSLPWEKAVQPKPGRLVLFPSYMWHGTIPITGDAERVTVAFDISAAG